MENPSRVIVGWASLIVALLIDSVVVWAPAVAVSFSAPRGRVLLALCLVVAFVAINASLYARGSTLGTYLCGFRIGTRLGDRPGRTYGLILTLVNFAALPVLAVIAVVSFSASNDISGPLGRPESYPLVGEQAHRRRILDAFDAYWERWSS